MGSIFRGRWSLWKDPDIRCDGIFFLLSGVSEAGISRHGDTGDKEEKNTFIQEREKHQQRFMAAGRASHFTLMIKFLIDRYLL